MTLSDSMRLQLVATLSDAERNAYEACWLQLQRLQADIRGNNQASYAQMQQIIPLLRTLKDKRQNPNLPAAAMTLYGDLSMTLLNDPAFQQVMGIPPDEESEKTKEFVDTEDWNRPPRRYRHETATPNTEGLNVTGHNMLHDEIGAGINELICDCGKVLFPDCDMSQVSINNCFNTHRLNVLEERGFDTRKLPQ